ncbi:uncharacterized protein L969DRAFT_414524 [Mixia osmundae IAM 14324]|uniref:pyridoxal 5'-phosphate synthase n=1 Tax=Mixia osmundae (strain CBS 9802 / IAM 14324 / JCM 22182 / KY 12970) TaxID=764103 RepID=G7E906_MIXOS|nr:uncharacterized protein L969DRAFT_414524 [Mixia osmundae IAM 14324]KEI40260.1 hypothetical protein L969DRAFT_414524 [Mixia osmundae IAM 14324]GAA99624.1 hypothetical protein E5Q_06325 [Mixia osmundae IAM 14324]
MLKSVRPCLFRAQRSTVYHHQVRAMTAHHATASSSESAPQQPCKTTSIVSHNQYHSEPLDADQLDGNPMVQFQAWFDDVMSPSSPVKEPEAFALSTVSATGIPSSRFVLLKQVDSRGFVFFTNYESRKGKEIAANPHVAMVFYWREVHKSVRVTGKTERLSTSESQAYYDTRPLDSRLGAHASPQSSVIADRKVLDDIALSVRQKYVEPALARGVKEEDVEIPVPSFWGGIRIVPAEVEMWSGRPDRLHDRFRYTRSGDSAWKLERLAP